MPIEAKEEYLGKLKNDEGKSRIVASIFVGDYGPRLSVIKTPLLMKALENVEDGKRVYIPLYLADAKTGE